MTIHLDSPMAPALPAPSDHKPAADHWQATFSVPREAYLPLLNSLSDVDYRGSRWVSLHGRNETWIVTPPAGRSLFVKRLVADPRESKARITRSEAFEQVRTANPDVRSPRLLAVDVDQQLTVHECVIGTRNGATLVVEEAFSATMGASVGRLLARIHSAKVPAGLTLDASRPALPAVECYDALPLAYYEAMTFGEIRAWGLQQNDTELVAALHELVTGQLPYLPVPCHCDLRLDQLLFRGDTAHLVDWEEFRASDPARDVGAFVGEFLFRAILDITTNRGDVISFDAVIDHQTMLRRGAEKIERLRPFIQAFWCGYRDQRGAVADELLVRATRFAGWHMLDRLLATAAMSGSLSGIVRAAAGVGRNLLLHPEPFTYSIGLGEETS